MSGEIYPFENIALSNVRLSFPKLITPEPSSPGADPTFGCSFLLAPNDPQFANFMSLVGLCAETKWKEKAAIFLRQIENDMRQRCYGLGDNKLKAATGIPYEGYPGMYYISASSRADRPPLIARSEDGQLVDNNNTMERTTAARKLYGGCYVNARIGLWAQDNQYGKGIRCNLFALQFQGEGTPFGDSGPDLTDAFKPVPGMQQPGMAPGMQQGMPWGQQPSWAPQAPQQAPWGQPAPQAPQQAQPNPWSPPIPPSWMTGQS